MHGVIFVSGEMIVNREDLEDLHRSLDLAGRGMLLSKFEMA